jgi:very-short-patch-repair endonuclease
VRLSESEYEALIRQHEPAERRAIAGRPPKARRKRQRSAGERELEVQLRAWGIGGWVTEHPFDAGASGGGRKWRLDFAFPALKLAVEVDGGVHRLADRFAGDIDKSNALALAGWTLLRFDPERITSGDAISTIRAALDVRQAALAAEETR